MFAAEVRHRAAGDSKLPTAGHPNRQAASRDRKSRFRDQERLYLSLIADPPITRTGRSGGTSLADITVIDMRSPHLDGIGDRIATMVLGAGPADVETVIVGGDVIKRDGKLVGHHVSRARDLILASRDGYRRGRLQDRSLLNRTMKKSPGRRGVISQAGSFAARMITCSASTSSGTPRVGWARRPWCLLRATSR
jgi:hypothetical protein